MTETLSLNKDSDQPDLDTNKVEGDSSAPEETPFIVDRKVSRNKEFAELRIGQQRDKFKSEADTLGNENADLAIKIAQLQAENEKLQGGQNQGMPTLGQFDNDTEQYQIAMNKFYQNQNQNMVNAQLIQFQANQATNTRNSQTDSAINKHYDRAQDFGKVDYNEAEDKASGIIGKDLVEGIIENTANSEQILYMLGNDSAKAVALANMSPMQATVEIGRLSAQAGSYTKQSRPDPEVEIEGGKAPTVSNANLQKRYEAALEKAQNGGNLEDFKSVRKQMREAGLL